MTLERLLLAFPKDAEEIVLRESIHGDATIPLLDLGYHLVKKVWFRVPGQIRRLEGQFDHLLELDCQHQKLSHFGCSLAHCKKLNLSCNNLLDLDLKLAPKIQLLNVSNNQLQTISHLPLAIKELICSNNALRTLQLGACRHLEKLRAENNFHLQIYGVPKTLLHIFIDPMPYADIHFIADSGSDILSHSYEEALREYFQLQHQTSQSKSCMQCKRKVGMKFETTKEHFVAICGDTKNPCGYHLELFRGDIVFLPAALDLYAKEKRLSKENMIRLQLDAVFGYKDEKEVVEENEVIRTAFENDSQILDDLLDHYVRIHFDPQKKPFRERQEAKRQEVLKEMNQSMDLKTIVQIYKREINDKPRLGNGPFDKWITETDSRGNKCATTASFFKNDVVFGESPRIVKFQKE